MKFKPVHAIVLLFVVVAAIIALKINSDRRAEAERQLKVQQQVEDAMNRQKQYEQKLKDDLENDQREAEFNRSLYGTSTPPPEVIQQRIEKHLRTLAEQREQSTTH
jgi:hypothetical protein